MFLTVAGPIGVGKTTLASNIAMAFPEIVLLSEDVCANPFTRAYDETGPAAVKSLSVANMQMAYMHQRIAAYLKARAIQPATVIVDRTLSEDFWIYLVDQVAHRDVWLRHAIPNILTYLYALRMTPWPTHVIVLNASSDTLACRISKRSEDRPFEQYIRRALIDRWQACHRFWQRYILPLSGAKILTVNTDGMTDTMVALRALEWLEKANEREEPKAKRPEAGVI